MWGWAVDAPQEGRAAAAHARRHAGTSLARLLYGRRVRPPRRGPGQRTSLHALRRAETAVLVVGPPRSGKTSALVVPAVLDAPAAVVSTSTKDDVLAATARQRSWLGQVYVFDPTGSLVLPEFVTPLRWSPVVGCTSFDRAASMAHALVAAARPGAKATESGHWVERAEALLTPLLFAAARGGRSMASVCQWVLARDLREPQAVIAAAGHEVAAAILSGVAVTDERERSGIFSTAAGVLSAYRSDAVLASAREPNFNPVAFAASCDALYICAPSHEQDQLATLVVALLEAIRAAVITRPRDAAPVLFALDEVANIAPLPSLPSLAAEGGGQGLVTLACLQDLSQARARWGDAADGFLTLFGAKIVLPGVADARTLGLISSLAGERRVIVPSVTRSSFLADLISGSQPVATRTRSLTWRPTLPLDAVARGKPGHGLFIEGTAMHSLRLVPWWEHPTWSRFGGPSPERSFWRQLQPRAGALAKSSKAAYRGPRVIGRGVGLRPWIWVAPGEPPRSGVAPDDVGRSLEQASVLSARVDEHGLGAEDDVARALRAAEYADDRPGFGTFFYDPEDEADDLFSEFAAVDELAAQSTETPPAALEVNVLGPVEVHGWRVVPKRKLLHELACYLALHPGRPLGSDELRSALWGRDDGTIEASAKSLRTYMSELRRSLGPEHLPPRRGAGYGLSGEVTTDWARFRALASRAQGAPDDELDLLHAALELVRGRPFAGVDYQWVYAEFLVSEMEVAIGSAARRLAELSTKRGDLTMATFANRRGLVACPFDFALWEGALASAAGLGADEFARTWRDAQATLGADASQLQELVANWRAARRC